MSPENEAILAKQPHLIAEFFRCIDQHPQYEFKPLTVFLTVHFEGEKVGGFNPHESHWYFSKVFMGNFGSLEIMKTYKFEKETKTNTDGSVHTWWQREGIGAERGFREAMVEMTGVPLD